MKYAEVNWIVVIVFAIGLISQLVEVVKRKRGGEEHPDADPDEQAPGPSGRHHPPEERMDDLLESLGLPRSSREKAPPPLVYEEIVTRPATPPERADDPFSEGPQAKFKKEPSRERYDSPFASYSEVASPEKKVERIHFDEDLEATENSSLNISAANFQVINTRQGVGDIRKQLKTPEALRQAFILKEILDPPKGLTM